jgi:hypothetical protein
MGCRLWILPLFVEELARLLTHNRTIARRLKFNMAEQMAAYLKGRPIARWH